MNILEICLNPSLGGLELYFSWCAEYFYNSSHQLLAVTLKNSRLDQLLTDKKIPTVHIEKKQIFTVVRAARALARICEEHQIDIVHVHYKNDLPIVALAKKISSRSFKVVHTRQMEMPGSKKDIYHQMIYSQIDHLICVTDKLKKDVIERLPMLPEKISRLYYGVKKPVGDKKRAEEFFQQYPSERVKVAMFSRIEESKGQQRLLKAMSQLRNEGVEFQAYIFGHFMTKDYEAQIQKMVNDLNLSPFVYWGGFQKNPLELMPFFDILAMPSTQETFGLVLIEAMAAGVAVIGSNTGGVPEIIDDGISGYTFSPDDIDEFAVKLKELILNSNKRAQFVSVAQKKYDDLFKYEDHFRALEETFEKVIQQ